MGTLMSIRVHGLGLLTALQRGLLRWNIVRSIMERNPIEWFLSCIALHIYRLRESGKFC